MTTRRFTAKLKWKKGEDVGRCYVGKKRLFIYKSELPIVLQQFVDTNSAPHLEGCVIALDIPGRLWIATNLKVVALTQHVVVCLQTTQSTVARDDFEKEGDYERFLEAFHKEQ